MTRRDFCLGGFTAAALVFTSTHWPRSKRKPIAPRRSSPPTDPVVAAPAEVDATVTPEFNRIAHDHPVLSQLRRAVCRTTISEGGFDTHGSAVRVSRDLLVATCHQAGAIRRGNVMQLGFLPHPDRALNYKQTTATLLLADPATDTTVWTLDNPRLLDRQGIAPVTCGDIGNGEHPVGTEVVAMGFGRGAQGEMDATLHRLQTYVPGMTVTTEDVRDRALHERTQRSNCKVDMSEPLQHGDSGGGVFDEDSGAFLGIITATNETDSFFTPVDGIVDAIARLAPLPYRHGFAPRSQTHRECRMG